MFSIENGLRLWVVGFSVKVFGDFMFASTRLVFDILVQDSLVEMFPLFGTGTGFRLPAAPDAPPSEGHRHFSPFDLSDQVRIASLARLHG
jgi:hypothetical protein